MTQLFNVYSATNVDVLFSSLTALSHCFNDLNNFGARCSAVVRAFAQGTMGRRIDPFVANPLSYFSFQPVPHDWCNKGCGMFYPVFGMMHIKEPLLLIGSGFPLSLS